MKNKKLLRGLCMALVLCMGIGGMFAYFTDTDTTTNTFTVGQISLDLQEPNWPGNDDPSVQDITPNQELTKDPQILNDGVNSEYVFATVAVPYANIKTAAEDGTVAAEAANTELYTLQGVSSDWFLMGYLDNDGSISATPVYRDDNTVVHLYAYGSADAMTKLAKDARTDAIFESVKFVNAVEDQNLEGTSLDIVINAYGIQTENIGDADTASEIWTIVKNANPATAQGSEDAKTDAKVSE